MKLVHPHTATEVRAMALTNKLIKEIEAKFGLKSGWQAGLFKSSRTIGLCIHSSRTIALSTVFLANNPLEEFEDTILHELAHAMDFQTRKKSDHSQIWKTWARRLGARPERLNSRMKLPSATEKPSKYGTVCLNCGKVHAQSRKKKSTRIASCATCDSRFNPAFILISNLTPAQAQTVLTVGVQAALKFPLAKPFAMEYMRYRINEHESVKMAANNTVPEMHSAKRK